MSRWHALVIVMMVTFGAACGDDGDAEDTTLPMPTTFEPSTTTSALTTTSAADRTTLPDTTSAPTTTSGTLPPPSSVEVLHPVPDRPPPPQPIDEQPSASDLRSATFCDPNSPASPAVTLTWVPAGSGAQLLAVATLPDGFESGRYTVSDELAAEVANHQISPIEPGGIYYWRVLTRADDRWLSSVQESFTGPVCVLDSP
jgi:hypothetical protein